MAATASLARTEAWFRVRGEQSSSMPGAVRWTYRRWRSPTPRSAITTAGPGPFAPAARAPKRDCATLRNNGLVVLNVLLGQPQKRVVPRDAARLLHALGCCGVAKPSGAPAAKGRRALQRAWACRTLYSPACRHHVPQIVDGRLVVFLAIRVRAVSGCALRPISGPSPG